MKILRVADIPNNRTGGMSRVMYCSGDAMSRDGHHVDYLFGPDIGPVRLAKFRRFVVPAKLVKLIALRHRRDGPYDVVEIHEPLAAVYAALWSPCSRLPPPVAISYGMEHRSHRARIEYYQLKGLAISTKMRVSPLSIVWQSNFALRRCRSVICFNSTDATACRRLGGPSERVVQTRSGVSNDLLDFGRGICHSRESRGKILFLGTWLERKGILDVVPATRNVLEKFAGASLTIAGCGVEEKRVRGDFPESLQSRINVIPRIESDRVLANLLMSHGIFVLASFTEGQPLAMLEAAAMGMALVGTDTPGISDFIENGRTGILVPVGLPDGLAASIGRLVTDQDETRRLGDAARVKVQTYTWAGVAADMLKAYDFARLTGRKSVKGATGTVKPMANQVMESGAQS